jgi:hypothetical protein
MRLNDLKPTIDWSALIFKIIFMKENKTICENIVSDNVGSIKHTGWKTMRSFIREIKKANDRYTERWRILRGCLEQKGY